MVKDDEVGKINWYLLVTDDYYFMMIIDYIIMGLEIELTNHHLFHVGHYLD